MSVLRPIFLLCLSVNVHLLSAQFVEQFGGPLGDMARVVVEHDGGYVLAGSTMNASNGEYDMDLVRTDLNGNVLWEQTFGTLNCDHAHGLIALNNNYVLCGSSIQDGRSDHDVYVVITDLSGNEQQSYYLGNEGFDQIAYDLIATSDGGFLLCGLTNATTDKRNDVLLMKFSSSWSLEWEQAYAMPGDQEAKHVVETGNGYALAGRHVDIVNGDELLYMHTDLSGNLDWSMALGGEDQESAEALVHTNSNTLMICGTTNSFGTADMNGNINNHIYLVHTNMTGDTLFTATLGDTMTHRSGYDLVEVPGGFVICGTYREESGITEQAYWARVDTQGELIWEHSWNNSNHDIPHAVLATSDGRFLLAGQTFGSDSYQFLLIKTDPLGSPD